MIEITKIQFDKFSNLQKSGIINMTDIIKGSKLIKENEEVYEEIMWNYKKYKNMFK